MENAIHDIRKDSGAKLNTCVEELKSISKKLDDIIDAIHNIGKECCGWK